MRNSVLKKLFKVFALCMAVVMIASTFAACGGGNNTPAEQGGNAAAGNDAEKGERSRRATVVVSEGLNKLDIHDQSVVAGGILSDCVYDALLESDRDGGYKCRLAEDYTVSEDGLTITVKVRQDAKFHDGTPVTADDVVCTYQRILDSETLNQRINQWYFLGGVEKVDDYTLKLILTEPNATFRTSMAGTAIIPKALFEKHGDTMFTENLNMTGSGPWKFVEWVDGQYLLLARNDEYWGGNDSYFEEVMIRFVTEASTAISAQLTGEVDAYYNTTGIPVELLDNYKGYEDKCEIVSVVGAQDTYLQFQCDEDSVFSDPDVRRAFSMAIDRQLIIDTLIGDGGIPIGVATENTNGWDPDFKPDTYTYNPEKAKALLESTGYNGEEVVISHVASWDSLALAICDMVNSIGFNCKSETVEAAMLADIRAVADYDMFIVFGAYSNGDIYSFLNFRIVTDSHNSNYVNEEVNELVKQSALEMDPDKRNELIEKANKIIAEECGPLITLFWPMKNECINYGITGFNFYKDGSFSMKEISWDPSLVK